MTLSANPAKLPFESVPLPAPDGPPSEERDLPSRAPAPGEPGATSSLGDEPVAEDGSGRWLWLQRLAEIVVAIASSALFVAWSRAIDVNPLVRVGQVSGLAALQLRFAVLCVLVVAALLLIELLRLRFAPFARKLACAAVAGLSSGLVAGGIVVALHGTPWGLFVNQSDVGSWMPQWTQLVLDGNRFRPITRRYLSTHWLRCSTLVTSRSDSR